MIDSCMIFIDTNSCIIILYEQCRGITSNSVPLIEALNTGPSQDEAIDTLYQCIHKTNLRPGINDVLVGLALN